MIAALLLAWGCESPPPLPASALDPGPAPYGRLVVAGPVRGYLARPGMADQTFPAELRLVEAINESTRAAALQAAAAGQIVLAVEPGVDTDAARSYLSGIPATGIVDIECQRSVCP